MARYVDGIFTSVFAESGDKAAPPFAITSGFTANYSVPITSGGAAPERTSLNYLYNQLYALGVDANRYGGGLIWDATITYEIGAIVSGSDSQVYTAVISNVGNNPVGDGGANWILVPSLSHLALNSGASEIGSSTGDTVEQRLVATESIAPFALARIDTDGTLLSSYNISSVVVGTNTYNITFASAASGVNYVCNVCPHEDVAPFHTGGIFKNSQTATYCEIVFETTNSDVTVPAGGCSLAIWDI